MFPDREHFGRIFYNQAKLSADGIAQIAAVLGSCTAGGAYVPAMSDEAVIVRNQGTIFLGGPPLVKAATGEVVTAEDLGGGDLHSKISGVTDHLADDDRDALRIVRRIVSTLGPRTEPPWEVVPTVDPVADQTELYDVVPVDARVPVRRARGHHPHRRRRRVRRVQGRLRHDAGHRFRPHPRSSGGDRRQQRRAVLRVGVEGRTFHRAVRQAQVPLLFLQNISGFMVGRDYEAGGIAKHGAKMVTAVACARVPKLTVVIGGSYGAGNYSMCGRAYSPRFLWMWPNARISVMGGEQAASVLATVRGEMTAGAGRRVQGADPRAVRRARAIPTTRRPDCGTTA